MSSTDRTVSVSDIVVGTTAAGGTIEIGSGSARREGTLDERNRNSYRGIRGQSFVRGTALQSAQTQADDA